MSDAARKIAVIVALDVAGYSARTEADEARTTSEVAVLRGVIEGIAARHAGRVFNTAGDGFMLEFGSSLAAVEAAFELAGKCEPKVRVGVHVGDVVPQPNGDLLGHGVNVAARLMARAEPGSTLISADVKRMIRGPVAERLQSCGTFKLDKMAETIEAFALAAVASATVAMPTKSAEPLLAVLPFDNLSNDPEMQFFSDGVSEEILHTIARAKGLTVVGRTSSFQFRGPDKVARKVASELRATHVLDGSVRRSGNRIRVSAHLVDAASQATMWAERYDRDLTDALSLQDEIATAIAQALDAALHPRRDRPVDPIAYDLYLRSLQPVFTPVEAAANISRLEQATARAPAFSEAWALLAFGRAYLRLFSPQADRPQLAAQTAAAADRALQLDPKSSIAYYARYWLEPPLARWSERLAILDKAALEARADSVLAVARTTFLAQTGHFSEAISCARQGYERDPISLHAINNIGWILTRAGKYNEARPILEQANARWPEAYYTTVNLLLACAGQEDWHAVDALISPERLAQFPLRELTPVLGLLTLWRHPSDELRRRVIEATRLRFEQTGHADIQQWTVATRCAAELGVIDEAYAIAERADFGPLPDAEERLGPTFDRSADLFSVRNEVIRRDPRFVRLCARLGLAAFWLQSDDWPDCANEVAQRYDFKAECEKAAREAAGS